MTGDVSLVSNFFSVLFDCFAVPLMLILEATEDIASTSKLKVVNKVRMKMRAAPARMGTSKWTFNASG